MLGFPYPNPEFCCVKFILNIFLLTMGIVAEVVNFVSCDQDVLCRWLQK